MLTNAQLDSVVLGLVSDGSNRMKTIVSRLVDKIGSHRDVDRSLQRLRRGKKISYTSQTGWKVVS